MGTRGLTAVILDGAHRIAQYGQWDHYPDGQGVGVLAFCHEWLKNADSRARFVDNLRRSRFATATDFAVAEAAGPRWKDAFPLWTRDHGAQVLGLVADADANTEIVLRDGLTFGLDRSCEYAYVIDLDANTLEVHEGHGREGGGRFKSMERPEGFEWYRPVALVATFDLANLPEEDAFLEALKDEDDS